MQATMEEKQHSTWYEVETDIALWKSTCPCGKDFLVHVAKIPLCPSCEKQMEMPTVLTQEQLDLFLDETNVFLPYTEEDVDIDTQIDAKNALEESLQQFDWWFGDRIQIQFIWNELRESHHSWEPVRKYLESAYVEAYHRDDY
uniref:Uncharacterized protein n=1 Tax=viral metagenome TaxID=1070528 RepID=A0A6C0BFS3_9ZZZZ